MKIDLLFITFNRLHYTKLALSSVLADRTEEFSLTIWDNASTDGTIEYLRNEIKDPRIKEIVFSERNRGQTEVVNEVWSRSKADLLGKLDNDCIVTPGWTRTLARAHEDIMQLGVVACWHFFPEDFDYARAKHKIERFGSHQIFRHPWTCGTGLLIKRETFNQHGPMRGKSTTGLWMKLAEAGYVNGYYYPLVLQEHMDDPRSQHNGLKARPVHEAYRYSYTWKEKADKEKDAGALGQEILDCQQKMLDRILDGSLNPKDYRRSIWKRAWGRALRLAKP